MSRILSIIILLAILGAAAALYYVVNYPQSTEEFTEFYILGNEGNAADYPEQLTVGEEARILLGISNQEQNTESYRVEIAIGGVTSSEIGPIVLKHTEKFEIIAPFIPDKAGEAQKVEFSLYKQGQEEVCESLHLWVNVQEKE